MKKLTPRQLFKKRLIHLLKVVADFCCQELGVKYKSFAAIHPNDPEYRKLDGYACTQRRIRVDLFNKKDKFHTLSYLIDTVVHECCHLVHFRHTQNFWDLHKVMTKKVKETFEIS